MSNVTSYKDAAERLSVPTYLVRRMARQGLIGVLEIPGAAPRVDVEEVRKALQRHTRPATFTPVDLQFKATA